MKFATVVKKAWEIRKNAAVRFSCPVMEIVWGDCFRIAMRGDGMDIIEKLKKIGGNEWIKNKYHRIYFNNLCELYGLETSHYKTGNIAGASLDGETISNNMARKIASELALLKIWFDVTEKNWVANGPSMLVNDYFKHIVDEIKSRIANV